MPAAYILYTSRNCCLDPYKNREQGVLKALTSSCIPTYTKYIEIYSLLKDVWVLIGIKD